MGEPTDIKTLATHQQTGVSVNFTPEESGDLLRLGCRHWGWGTQAECCATSYSLCWAHPPPPQHTQGKCHADPDMPLPQSTNGD